MHPHTSPLMGDASTPAPPHCPGSKKPQGRSENVTLKIMSCLARRPPPARPLGVAAYRELPLRGRRVPGGAGPGAGGRRPRAAADGRRRPATGTRGAKGSTAGTGSGRRRPAGRACARRRLRADPAPLGHCPLPPNDRTCAPIPHSPFWAASV